ncbi:DUF5643 domain-containing protein [Saccharibacillus sp. CPCC 101409]|uniref:DUF5643 domain-containing protein n=1 Tax=Saccharibacillus sp. CPCC 101409 TaxID=3058041 RepID=UPI002672DD3B|nr:DUF5643 domain-containing protein [Saccharibacillus sp. CPCC 101409]MDO3411773.1 DUF5643 domain-containing protein [Saccharibacillus sp. CPCC 101409]
MSIRTRPTAKPELPLQGEMNREISRLKTSILSTPIEVDLTGRIMQSLDRKAGAAPASSPGIRSAVNKRFSRRRKALTAVIAAAAGFALLLGTSAFSPAAASAFAQIPGVGGIFRAAGDLGLEIADRDGLYSEIAAEDTHRGLTLKASAVSYDGTRVSVAIERSGSEDREDLGSTLQDVKLTIDGRKLQAYSSLEDNTPGIFTYPTSDKDSLIVEFSDLKNQGGEAFPDRFDAALRFYVAGIDQPFELDVPVRKNTDANLVLASDAIHSLRLKTSKTFEGVTFTLKKIESTPVTLNVTTELKLPTSVRSSRASGQTYGYDLLDDQGRKLKQISGSGWNAADGSVLLEDDRFEPFEERPQSLTIKPFTYRYRAGGDGLFELDDNGGIVVDYIPRLEMTIPLDEAAADPGR